MITDRLNMKSIDFVSKNIESIAELFPNCVTETSEGKRIDFTLLQQELSGDIVDGAKERYRLEWAGKREAIVNANLRTTNTLRPIREDSVDFDKTENIYIEGDNLEVLKILQESYLNKIKMIYIDPPYNTGNDFIYKDDFKKSVEELNLEEGNIDEQRNRLVANSNSSGRYHSDWLSMMYPRLKLARNLLTEDGVIFISIDDNEVHNLRKICDEVFGDNNFLGCAGRISKKANNQGDYWAPNFDYLLTFSKNKEFCSPFFGGINYKAYNIIEDSGSRKGEYYQLIRLYMTSLDPMRGCSNQRYFIECPDGSFVIPPGDSFPEIINDGEMVIPQSRQDKVWRWSQKTYLENKDKIVVKQVSSSNLVNERGEKTNWNVFTKTYLSDVIKKSTATPNNFIENHINQNATHELNSLKIPFDFAKPSSLIKFLADTCIVKDSDIVLDFFSGSGTSGHAVMQLNSEDGGNRKFIMVQIPEECDEKSEAFKAGYKNICEIGKERIRRAGRKIVEEQKLVLEAKKGELNKRMNGQMSLGNEKELEIEELRQEIIGIEKKIKRLDCGFRVFRLDSSNMKDVYYMPKDYKQEKLELFATNIKEDRETEDLIAQVMLDWGLELSKRIEKVKVAGKEVYKIENNALYCCFDEEIDEKFIRELAKQESHPLRIVFKDSSFKDDTAKENVAQLIKQLCPETEIKVI